MSIKRRFTKWYVKKGYKFGYDFTDVPVYEDGFMKTPCGIPKSVWHCPWWVKPFLFLFSPSVYAKEDWGEKLVEGFMAGMKMGMEAKGIIIDYEKRNYEDIWCGNFGKE